MVLGCTITLEKLRRRRGEARRLNILDDHDLKYSRRAGVSASPASGRVNIHRP